MPKIGVANPTSSLEALVDADLDTLVTALYVKIDDKLVSGGEPAIERRDADTGAERDFLERRFQALFGEHLAGRGHDRRPVPRGIGPQRPRAGRGSTPDVSSCLLVGRHRSIVGGGLLR